MKVKTIKRSKLRQMSVCDSPKMPQVVAMQETRWIRKRWVGIGWVNEGEATGKEDAVMVEDDDNRRIVNI